MSDNPFSDLIGAMIQDPQFMAVGVMADSLGPVLGQMNNQQQMATQKLINQFARALDEAGMLVIPKEE